MMGTKGSPPNPIPKAPKRPKRTRLFLDRNEYIPTVEAAIELLAGLSSDQDPVEVKLDNGKYMDFVSGLSDFDCGGIIRMSNQHANCPSCTCTLDIDAGGSSDTFLIRYYSMDRGQVEGSLFDMVLDRMGITKG